MKKLLSSLFLAITGFLNAQTVEIPAESQPFYEVLEWKGQGALLLSRDPSLNQKQIKVSMLSGDLKPTWQDVFNPLGDEIYYISEDNGKYVYFLENLELKSGKIYFHQLNASGNFKTTNVSFGPALKKLGDYQYDDLFLTDIVTTDKALVYVFTHSDKAKNKKTTIAITMTHHNFLCYATIVAENVSGSNKVEDQVSWYVAGENAENVIYAARTHAGKDAGWRIKEFGPKGNFVKEFSISSSGTNFLQQARVGFGRRGSALLKRLEPLEKGTLLYVNGMFYIGGIELDGTVAKVTSYQWKDSKWEKICSSPLTGYSAKKDLQFGFLPMKEGIGFYVKNSVVEGHFHSFSNATGIVSGKVTQEINNPSRLFTAEYPNNFVAALPGKWLVFDLTQLPAKGSVKFEYTQR